jgi:hypothetical protein
MFKNSRCFTGVIAVSTAALLSASALAGSATIVLARSTLSNTSDSDGGGLWQYEGGTIQNTHGTAIGTYIANRRVTTSGTSLYNTAAETISLFFAPKVSSKAPNVIALEGAYSYNSGNFIGSVSAASYEYHDLIGSDASAEISNGTATLVITWIGPSRGLP